VGVRRSSSRLLLAFDFVLLFVVGFRLFVFGFRLSFGGAWRSPDGSLLVGKGRGGSSTNCFEIIDDLESSIGFGGFRGSDGRGRRRRFGLMTEVILSETKYWRNLVDIPSTKSSTGAGRTDRSSFDRSTVSSPEFG